jgi:deoxycytidylate deaminase
MQNRHDRYIDYLFKLAQDIEAIKSSRVTSCVVYKNEIVGFGFCQMKTHPMQAQFTRHHNAIYLHAEIDAIKNALKRISVDDISRATLYIARAKKEQGIWQFGLSRPCDGCMKAISSFDINNVIYTTDEDYMLL